MKRPNEKIEDVASKEICDRIGERERAAIYDVLRHSRTFGYGNMIAWISAAWAAQLRDDGINERAAIDFVSNQPPYPLAKK